MSPGKSANFKIFLNSFLKLDKTTSTPPRVAGKAKTLDRSAATNTSQAA
jgi:hypothetical protein